MIKRHVRQYLIDQAIIIRNLFTVSLPLRRLRTAHLASATETATHFVIIPGHVNNPSGSLGDMAMLTALLQALRTRNARSTFTIIGTRNHSITVPGIGEVPVVPAWAGRAGLVAFDRVIRKNHALFVMGADILDGKYGAVLVQRIVDYCNHSVQLGIPATMLGFSFNRQPRRPTVHALSRLHPRVTVNVRDQVSLDRFIRTVGITAHLCADSAFLMPAATDPDPPTEAWIAANRSAGRSPVGVNLNAHALAPALLRVGSAALITHLATQLSLAGEANALAFILIPHDLKPNSADVVMLRALEDRLQKIGFPHVRYSQINRPDKIKRIAGLLDLVITGRMHLAIASLGSCTPTLCIIYQDKFEGLYQHFGLALEHTISPMQCLSGEFLIRINNAYAQRLATRGQICARLPKVKELASRNLAIVACR